MPREPLVFPTLRDESPLVFLFPKSEESSRVAEITLEKRYDPQKVEEKWYRFWMEGNLFHATVDSSRKPYSIVIPPPNVTGILTMGHVLNNTIQDILVRWRRMQGFNALWLPGTDHAGIATQNVVEKELAKRGLKREDLGREQFLDQVWEWKRKYGGKIIQQLQQLGCSCDWHRERFTMDEGLSQAVLETFVRLYEKGLIYRGKYIINWCPRCRTALADEEVEHQELGGHLWYIKYPIKDSGDFITVATTRPETMLGDTAVAVNPTDERYLELQKQKIILPIVNRELPVIADDFVDPQFGTGIVKVTPAHDPNDFEMGQRHGLESINIMHPDATMNENAGDYAGMDRFECRERLLADLKERDLLVKVKSHAHALGHCYRCHTAIEPYLSDQWFVKMKPLAEPARRVVEEGRIKFYPRRWTKVYLNWIENIRDWCISRQIWWGHRIPIWHCEACGEVIAAKEKPSRCSKCESSDLRQDEDVLDTWFSSWLWPFSTLGWPEKTPDLEAFYPTDVLVTGPDIIFFWVARMVMAAMEFMGEIPFPHVYINGMVKDQLGRWMSKSLGNSPDPTEIIEEFGADALRLSMILITAEGQDAYFSKDKLVIGRNFANKIWNASRFVLMNLGGFDPGRVDREKLRLTLVDRWIISALQRTISGVTASLEKYRLNEAAHQIYEFFWHEFCDWYLEWVKPRLYDSEDQGDRETALWVTTTVLDKALRLLHPFMPFITEELWQQMPRDGESLMVAQWPRSDRAMRDSEAEEVVSHLRDLIGAIRNIRAEMNIPPVRKALVLLKAEDEKILDRLRTNSHYLLDLAKIKELVVGMEVERSKATATAVVKGVEVLVPLEGLIDLSAERQRLEKEIQRISKLMAGITKKLNNEDFLHKAPKEVVARERAKGEEYGRRLAKLQENLKFTAQ
jgi:valyl-tRNA synthetase